MAAAVSVHCRSLRSHFGRRGDRPLHSRGLIGARDGRFDFVIRPARYSIRVIWLRMQQAHDLWHAERRLRSAIEPKRVPKRVPPTSGEDPIIEALEGRS